MLHSMECGGCVVHSRTRCSGSCRSRRRPWRLDPLAQGVSADALCLSPCLCPVPRRCSCRCRRLSGPALWIHLGDAAITPVLDDEESGALARQVAADHNTW